jgi:hypothetical protein
MKFAHWGLVLAAFAGGAAPTVAADNACESAVETYNDASRQAADTARSYMSCVVTSAGQNDCGSRFRSLRSAHQQFEEAVARISDDCQS